MTDDKPPTDDAARVAPTRGEQRRRQRASRRWRALGERSGITALAAILVSGALWLTYQFVEPAPPDTLRMASGRAEGAYHAFARELAREFAAEGITLEIVETDGSVDNLARLEAGQVDMAFVQSGLATPARYPELEGLGSLYFEPVWVFSTQVPPPIRIGELTGKRLAIGPKGSGTRRVALQLLQANGLPDDAVTLDPASGMSAADALLDGRIDTALMIASPDAAAVRRLLDEPSVALMDFDRAQAYARRYPFLTALVLPAGVIDLQRDLPTRNVDLLATAATLVAHGSLHPALADLAMQAIDRVFATTSLFAAAGRFPSPDFLDFPLSAEAERYYKYGTPFLQRYLPFWAATLIDRLKLLALPLLALLLPLSRLLPPAYRWTVRKKVFRWYEQVQRIDQRANDDPDAASLSACLADLSRIEDDAREVAVPLGYAHELYALRLHIDLLARQIERRIDATPPDASHDAASPAR